MSGARRLVIAIGLIAMTAALAAAFVTASTWLYVLAALAGLATLLTWQVRGA